MYLFECTNTTLVLVHSKRYIDIRPYLGTGTGYGSGVRFSGTVFQGTVFGVRFWGTVLGYGFRGTVLEYGFRVRYGTVVR